MSQQTEEKKSNEFPNGMAVYLGSGREGVYVGKRELMHVIGGCFAAALHAVRAWGGVLEHPEASSAWAAFGLLAPPRDGGWVAAGDFLGWTCCVEQGHYGHRARKATWLYVTGAKSLPSLKWGKSAATGRIDLSARTTAERRRIVRTGACQQLSARQRAATPIPFRDLLLGIAQSTEQKQGENP